MLAIESYSVEKSTVVESLSIIFIFEASKAVKGMLAKILKGSSKLIFPEGCVLIINESLFCSLIRAVKSFSKARCDTLKEQRVYF